MHIETVPIILGILVALAGALVMGDAWGDPERGPGGRLRERRRRVRAAIDQRGEQMAGVGILLLGVALIGRDRWRFGILTTLVGTVLVVWGGIRNRHYFREILLFRGAARRTTAAPPAPAPPRRRAPPPSP